MGVLSPSRRGGDEQRCAGVLINHEEFMSSVITGFAVIVLT